MNPFRTAAFRALAFGLALPLAALLGAVGCDIDSTDSTASTIADNEGNVYNYSGLYMNTEEGSTNGYGALVFPAGKQSGVKLIWLRLLQYGSVLEGYDNAGMTWAGSLTAQNGGVASFGLKGRTTAGVSVDVAGTLSYAPRNRRWMPPGSSPASPAASSARPPSPLPPPIPQSATTFASVQQMPRSTRQQSHKWFLTQQVAMAHILGVIIRVWERFRQQTVRVLPTDMPAQGTIR